MAVLPLLLAVYEEDGGCLPILMTVYEEDGCCVAYTVDYM